MSAKPHVPVGDRESTGLEPGGLDTSSLLPKRPVGGRWMPIVITLLGLGLTVWATLRAYDQSHGIDHQRFDVLSERLKSEIGRRVGVYRSGLTGLRALYAASSAVSRSEFRRAIETHDLASEFPGAHGIGYVRRVALDEVEGFLAETRADGAPEFKLKTSGQHADLRVIELVEPLNQNREAEGFDIGQEPNRRATSERAMHTGEATLTSKLALVQAVDRGPGFLYLLPVYRGGALPSTQSERVARLQGWLYMPILAARLFEGVASVTDDELSFDVFENTSLTADGLIYDDTAVRQQPDQPASISSPQLQLLQSVAPLAMGGHTWFIKMTASPRFHAQPLSSVWAVALAGCALSILLGLLLRSQSSAVQRARALAESMTSDVRRLALVAQHSTNGVLICDAEQRITWVNRGFSRITGHAARDLVGSHLAQNLAYDRTEHETIARLEAALRDGQAFRGELVRRGRGSQISYVQADIQPLTDERGKPTGFISVETDVTENARAQAALHESQSKLEQALAALEEAQSVGRLGSWSLDPATGKMDWSKQLYGLLERAPVAGPPDFTVWQALFKPTDATRHQELVAQAAAYGTSYSTVIERAGASNGVRHVRIEGRARREAERVAYLYGTVMDVTAEIEREESLRIAQRRAEDASRSKSEFLANMSHEIRTPMTAILGFAELLADDGPSRPSPEQRQEYSDTIKRNGEHLLSIINDILDISKIEAGMLKTERIEIDLQKLLDDVIPMMTVTAHAKGLALKYAARTPLPIMIKTDPVRLRQILINLIGNAVKFTEIGSVTISASFETFNGAQLRFDITDTGIGMTPEQSKNIFGAFQQADSSTTRKFGGTGLGLQISKRLAQFLGGDISFRTEYGKGSTFSVSVDTGLPTKAAMSASSAMRTQPLAPLPRTKGPPDQVLKGARILLAEDGLDNQRLVAFHLTKAGATVKIVDNGKLAIEQLCEDGDLSRPLIKPSPYDVLLSDMQMPVMDGYAAARLLREKGCELPIVALTAHAMSGDIDKCLAAGCDGYTAKPIDRGKLIEMCMRAMAGELRGPNKKAAAPSGDELSSVGQ
ncbi:MAG: CHASE domain-containing protein [Polyangiales bacterium]